MQLDNFNYLIVKSILSGKLYPVNKFMNSSEINSVVNDCKFHKKVFPVPIILGLRRSKNINKKYLNLYYKKKKITKLRIESEFKLDLKKIFRKLVGKKFRLHPLYKYYKKYNYFISSQPLNQKVIKNFKIKNNSINFTTRNKPHEGHKKIINFFAKNKNKNIIISITQKNKKNNFMQIKKDYKKFLKTNDIEQKVKIYNFKFPHLSWDLEKLCSNQSQDITFMEEILLLGEIILDLKIFLKRMIHLDFVKNTKNI